MSTVCTSQLMEGGLGERHQLRGRGMGDLHQLQEGNLGEHHQEGGRATLKSQEGENIFSKQKENWLEKSV